MRVQNVNEHELEVVARCVGVGLRNVRRTGQNISLGLTVLADKTWRRQNPVTKRPLQGVCIHGHDAFTRTLFRRHPNAQLSVVTADRPHIAGYPYCACRAGLLAYGDGININCSQCQTTPCVEHRVLA